MGGVHPRSRAVGTTPTRQVLLVDDNQGHLDSLWASLHGESLSCHAVRSAEEALAHLERQSVDVVVTDLQMDGMDGLELTKRIKQEWNGVGVIIMTAYGTFSSAVESIRFGAYNYLIKPFPHEELRRYIEEVCSQRKLGQTAPRVAPSDDRPGGLVGSSPPMADLKRTITTVGASDARVLILGESGTGKELVARAIHENSRRSDKLFLAENCGAIPETLFASKLFGSVKGAFTSAENRIGLFVAAGHGTLFLDEIAEMPLDAQVNLLRAIEEREITPIGATKPVRWHARLVAATNRDIETEVREGRFREDLFFRVNVIQLTVPPLRDRRGDIPELVDHFLDEIAEDGQPRKCIRGDALEILTAYNWPGNVRELRNVVERACAIFTAEEITPSELPAELVRESSSSLVVGGCSGRFPTLDEVEARHIREALRRAGGVKKKAAELLGIDRNRLRRRMLAHGIT